VTRSECLNDSAPLDRVGEQGDRVVKAAGGCHRRELF
jgi:hypothetical protein